MRLFYHNEKLLQEGAFNWIVPTGFAWVDSRAPYTPHDIAGTPYAWKLFQKWDFSLCLQYKPCTSSSVIL